MVTGKEVRAFLRDLFGSRLVAFMEAQLYEARNENTRLVVRHSEEVSYLKSLIEDLRKEKTILNNEIAELKMSVYPTVSKVGADIVKRQTGSKIRPNFGTDSVFDDTPRSEWEKAQEQWDQIQQEDGKAATNAA